MILGKRSLIKGWKIIYVALNIFLTRHWGRLFASPIYFRDRRVLGRH